MNNHEQDIQKIVMSKAFRRLGYKTQVFVNHESDHARNRLTHSIEVAMLSRTVASQVGLNATLCEVIGLAHDMGHPPFGHSGEEVLNALMVDNGGFDHNKHLLRLITKIEPLYLSSECLSALDKTGVMEEASFETQLVNQLDRLVYCLHDVDDGLRAGYFNYDAWLDFIKDKLCWDVSFQKVQLLQSMRCFYIEDLIGNFKGRGELVFSYKERDDFVQIKNWLYDHLYKHPKMQQREETARNVVSNLFNYYLKHWWEIPVNLETISEDRSRLVCDYIAGMTDRFAIKKAKDFK